MKNPRIDVASIRRDQIVEAAMAVIMEQGLQNLSLSEIEKRAGMSRGQLTYYFPAKEDILLAVFDRVVLLMHQRVGTPEGQECGEASGWEWVQHLLKRLLTEPPVSPAFGHLQYTFLAQIGHREDFRRRLANLYESWRSNMSLGFTGDMVRQPPHRDVSPRALATLVQAIMHGLLMQRAADPEAFDGQEMMELCLDMLGTFLWDKPRTSPRRRLSTRKKPAAVTAGRVYRQAGRRSGKGVNGERVHGT
jgi:AcrR family transcriptional regulator